MMITQFCTLLSWSPPLRLCIHTGMIIPPPDLNQAWAEWLDSQLAKASHCCSVVVVDDDDADALQVIAHQAPRNVFFPCFCRCFVAWRGCLGVSAAASFVGVGACVWTCCCADDEMLPSFSEHLVMLCLQAPTVPLVSLNKEGMQLQPPKSATRAAPILGFIS